MSRWRWPRLRSNVAGRTASRFRSPLSIDSASRRLSCATASPDRTRRTRPAAIDALLTGAQHAVEALRAAARRRRRVIAVEETGRQVLELLEQLTRKAGKNLILVTHSQDNAVYADRVVELREGCFETVPSP